MKIREIKEFHKIRKQARTYFCYLFQRNIVNRLPKIELETILHGLERIIHDIPNNSVGYILNTEGKIVGDLITFNKNLIKDDTIEHVNRAYFYKSIQEKKCILTDPYPSPLTGEMVVSVATPIFNNKRELLYVVVIEISLSEVLKIVHIDRGDAWIYKFNKIVYSVFAGALFAIVLLLFFDGIRMFFSYTFNNIDVKKMFESTILITLSLALFDLSKTILFEEVIEDKDDHPFAIHKTMIKFLGSIVIALAIEGLMLVFKFAMIDPQKLLYASVLLGAVTLLLIGLAYYMKSVGKSI